MRQGRSGIRGKFVQVEPRMSQTGANADEWVPVRPGTEGVLALGMAHVIINSQLRPAAASGAPGRLIDGWSAGLPAYTPEEVERRTGVAAARLQRLAQEFAGNAPAIAIIGCGPLAHTNAMFNALAVNALNALVGSVGVPGGILFTPQPTELGGYAMLHEQSGGTGVVAVQINKARQKLVLLAQAPAAGADKDYELWVIPPGGAPIGAGLLALEPDGRALAIAPAQTADRVGTVAVTLEPAGGSVVPTLPNMIAAGTLSN